MFHSLSANNKEHLPYFTTTECIPSSQIQPIIGRCLCFDAYIKQKNLNNNLSVLNAEPLKHCLVKQHTSLSMSTELQKINTAKQKESHLLISLS